MIKRYDLETPKVLITLFLLVLMISFDAAAQNEVAIGSTSTKSNAILWLNGNGSQGLILPVVTNKTAVSSPDKGMIVYDNSDNKVWYRNDNTWVEVGGGGANTTSLNLNLAGNELQLLNGTTVQSKVNIAGGTPVNGAFMGWNGTSWQYTTLSDIGGGQVIGIKGKSIPALPATTQALVYDGAAWKFQSLTAGADSQTLTFASPNLSISNGNSVDLSALDKDAQTLNLTGSNLSISGGNSVTLPGSTVPTLKSGEILIGNGTANSASTLSGDATLSAGALTIGNNAITTAKINANAVDATKLANDAVTSTKILDGTITANDLSSLGATNSGQVLQWNGSLWVPVLPSSTAFGNLTTTTAGLAITGGTGAVAGSGATLNIQNATASQPGLLTATDFTTFSGKVSLGGDLGGTAPSPLVTKIQGVGVSSTIPSLNQVLQYDGSNWVPSTLAASGDITDVIAGTGLSGGGTTGSVTLSLANSGVTSGVYGSATAIPQMTIDAFGRITAVTTFPPNVADGSITGGTAGAGVKIAANTITDANILSLNAGKITAGTLPTAQVPNLDASKITTGTFANSQIPNLDASKITSGIISTQQGGTGISFSAGSIGDGQLLIGSNSGQTFVKQNLNQGNGINITNGSGTITITNSGDTDATNDITTSTAATGDLTGTFPNLTIAGTAGAGTNAVTAINASASKINFANLTIPTANTSTTGLLSSADWNTFNNKDNSAINEIQNLSFTGTGSAANGESFPLNISAGTGVTIKEGTNVQIDQAANVITINSVAGGSGTVTNVTGSLPISVVNNATTPAISISQATTSTDGYLSSADWNAFNIKQPQLNGTGFIKATGTTITYDNSTYLTSFAETDPAVKAINGLVKSNGTTISAAIAGTDYLTPTGSAALLTSFPTLNQNTTGTASTITGTITEGQVTNLVTDLAGKQTQLSGTGFVKATGTTITYDNSAYLTSFTETDPAVKAINGLVKSNGTTISSAIAETDYLTPTGSAALLTSFPTLNQNTTGTASTITGTITEAQVTNLTTDLANKVTANGAITGATNTKITYDSKGLVTAGTTLVAVDIPDIAESQVTNLVTDLAGKQPQLSGTGFVKASGTTITYDNTTYLTSYTETDPSVIAINGLVKSNGTAISAAIAGTDYLTPTGSAALLTSFPTLNQNTTGSAATLTTPRNIYGNSFDGTADLTQVIASTFGGTGNGFAKFSGPTTTEKTFTLPDASATILTSNAAVTVAQGGTGLTSSPTNGQLLIGNGTGYTLSTITAGTGISISNAAGGITITNSGGGGGWGTSGNTGLTSANYIGTTDAVPFNIKVNGVEAGIIDPTLTLLNTTFGENSGGALTTGQFNTAMGYHSLSLNSTGNENTSFGYKALESNTVTHYNTAFGKSALFSQTGAGNGANTAIGYHTLYQNTTGYYNIGLGYFAGTTGGSVVGNTTGFNNTFIGANSGPTANNFSNATAIGAGTTVNASNKVRIGNASVTVIEGQVSYSNASDRRLKDNIKLIDHGLGFIMKLKPVSYSMKSSDARQNWGFIAQDIEELVGTENAILTVGLDSLRTLSLRYTDFIAPIVRAMQEQQKEIEELKAKLKEKDEKMNSLEGSVTTMKDEIENIKRVLGMEAKATLKNK